jgi:spore maturation protein CgeB
VGFEDLVFHTRRAEGRLDDLETSLLFLDEWKKQYKK